ncbi:hypothetical protein [Micropruina glycogenica]|uniref:Uncharacterized protein n=1 Tax=Micropruina glycogenica TaxID=75385 RepID=A0A2N9JEM7_9ACTN|nr:hypothetical protein [Micropruina glycogenica]SPD85978.1 conserved protein of unknown function [Micropruina glycogenica]
MSESLPEGVSWLSRHSKSSKWKLATGEDLEHALRAAERLLAQAEGRQQHAQNRSFAIVSLIVGAALSMLASMFLVVQFMYREADFQYTALAIPFTLLPAVGVLLYWFRLFLAHKRQTEEDATVELAAELASLVGEVMNDVAQREAWSYMRIKATQLRLSAFPMPRFFSESGRWRTNE